MFKKLVFAVTFLFLTVHNALAQELSCTDVLKNMESAVNEITSASFQFTETCEDKALCNTIYQSYRPDWLNGQAINYFYHSDSLAMAYANVPNDRGGNTYDLSQYTQLLERSGLISKDFYSRETLKIGTGNGKYDSSIESYSGSDKQSSRDKIKKYFTDEKYPNVRTHEISSFSEWPTLKGLFLKTKGLVEQSTNCTVESSPEDSSSLYTLTVVNNTAPKLVRINIEPKTWLPTALMGYQEQKLYLKSQWQNIKINTESLWHPGKVTSFKITHVGIIHPSDDKENCFHEQTYSSNFFNKTKPLKDTPCYRIQDTAEIPAAYGVEAGITFTVTTDDPANRPIPLLISDPMPDIVDVNGSTNEDETLSTKSPKSNQNTNNQVAKLKAIYQEQSYTVLAQPGKEYFLRIRLDPQTYFLMNSGVDDPILNEALIEIYYFNEKLGEQRIPLKKISDPYSYLGTYGKRIPECKERIKKDPTDYTAHYCLAMGCKELSWAGNIEEELSEAIKLNPKFIPAYLERAEYYASYKSLERLTKAIEDYQKVLTIDPEYANIVNPKLKTLNQEKLEIEDSTKKDIITGQWQDSQTP